MSTNSILGRFEKQAGETLDYKFDFTDWLKSKNTTAASATVTKTLYSTGDEADDFLPFNVISSTLTGSIVTALISCGEEGEIYKVSCALTTANNLVKIADILINIQR
jgi:hypothetical protein